MKFVPRSLRNRLTLVLAVGSAILVTVLVLGFNVFLRNQNRADLDRRLNERASAALSSVDVSSGRVRVREAANDEALDQQVWVFGPSGAVESPAASPAADRVAAALAQRPGAYADVAGVDLRLHSVAIIRGARRVGSVVSGVSTAPYETSARRALVDSIGLGLFVVIGILVVVRLTIHAALEPVDRMTAEAADWSVDDIDRRFTSLTTDDELARLGSTFNDLLSRLGASLRHERSFSSEVSHELRTPLAKLIIEADLALRRERTPADYRAAVASMRDDALQMQSVVETLLAVARHEIDARRGTADAYSVATAVVEALAPVRDDVAIDVHGAESGIRVGVDRDLAERVLSPVVANAFKFANQTADITIERTNGAVRYIVHDDGPGVSLSEREAIFSPGYRAAPSDSESTRTGTGLGLALARRLATAADGTVTCEPRDDGGRFVITLPGA